MYEELKRRKKEYEGGREYKIDLQDYSGLLKREINRENNRMIDGYIREGSYDEAVNYVERVKGIDLELPLKNIVSVDGIDGKHRGIVSEERLILNERLKNMSMLESIKEELSTCGEFIFIVSFIRYSGLQLLISRLRELEARGIKGKILTSVYMNITEPKALRKLMEFENIEVKIYNAHRDSFHTKAYIFMREDGLSTSITGSSNISHQALLCGEEWNIKVGEDTGGIIEGSLTHFEKLWSSEEAIPLTEEVLSRYERYRGEMNESRDYTYDFLREETRGIQPNSMQREILDNLRDFRERGIRRALAVAATGTGKTYLSAFDIREAEPGRVLFLAHREELLRGARRTYEVFFMEKKMGYLTGNEKNFQGDMIFATIQTLNRKEYLEEFSRDYFDYIVVDEFHHSAAESYLRVIDYFTPKFLLGLTATPERMDGKDILEICHYNIAGEIRLREALERELLVPFHYFGIADDEVDYSDIPERGGRLNEGILSKRLSINTRVDFILDKIGEYLYDGEKMCSIGFCVDKNHARYMKDEFEKRGMKTEVILADTPQRERNRIIEDLEKRRIDIVFTVDIFNEGVDIPQVNLLLFLRPTESSTIFIQQLGRGMRKAENKSYVTVLDFIGNYRKAFTGALSLTRELGEGRDRVRRNVEEGFAALPGSSNVEFDRICQKRILDKMGEIRYTSKIYAREMYAEIRGKYDRPLKATDFLYEEDAYEVIVGAFGSFYEAKAAMKDSSWEIEDRKKQEVLQRIDGMIPAKRPHEGAVLRRVLLEGMTEISPDDISDYMGVGREAIQEARIMRSFRELEEEYKKQEWSFGRVEGNLFIADREIGECLTDDRFREEIEDRLNLLEGRLKREFSKRDGSLEIHKTYSRLELQILLDSRVPKGSWRAGYAVAGEDICLFITMEKEETVEEHLLYDNYFDNQRIVQWISQNKTSHSSKVGEMFVKHKEMGMRVHLFIRRAREIQGITQDFIYLGEGDYHSSSGDKPMYIKWELHQKVPDKIFLDLTS